MQHVGVQKAEGIMNFRRPRWCSRPCNASSVGGLSRLWEAPLKVTVLTINYRKMDFLACPYLTNTHVNIIAEGVVQTEQESWLWCSKCRKCLVQGRVRIGGH